MVNALQRVLLLTVLLLSGFYSLLTAQAPVSQFGIVTTNGCAPLITGFANDSENATDYLWLFPGGQPSSSTEFEPSVSYDLPGEYPVSLIATNAQGSDTSGFFITVLSPIPVAEFNFQSSDQTVSFNNQSTDGNFFIWDFGDGNSSTEENPVHTYEENGTYMIRLTVINDCQSITHTDVFVLFDQLNIPSTTANDAIPSAKTDFLPGTNLGYFPPWKDTELADISAGNPEVGQEGVGVKTIRPLLPESFLEQWGYDIRVDAFAHYHKLGLKDNTMIIGFPSDEHRDTTHYCSEYRSELFSNMYTPIWDNGENGTPVNDDNPLALYLWRMVHLYGQDIKFWEIWNEPGFDFSFVTGFLDPGQEGNWWENDPDPCDYKLRAPIYHYNRMLRICYEVIKTIQPEAHLTLGSVGFPSFMDAVLRNTDNPVDGSPTPEYPLGGGAYFDVVTIHAYPHFDGSVREWDEETQSFVYGRHTDRAADGIARTQNLYQNVLTSYGYDGITYPKKKWIITEIAVPRKPFGEFFGSDELQINYLIKAYIACEKNEIEAMHIFDMSESHFLDDAVSEFQVMGLFQRLFGVLPYQQIKNQQADAYKTVSDLLYGSTYDPDKEATLNLPDGIRGAAFLDKNGHHTYVLWAATTLDNSEFAEGVFSFPNNFNISLLEKRTWDFSTTQTVEMVSGNNIPLSGRPIFFTDKNNRVPISPTANFSITQQEGCVPMTVEFSDASTTNTTEWSWSFPGGFPSTSTEQNPVVVYDQAGEFPVTLTVGNSSGTNMLTKSDFIQVSEVLPTAAFSTEINGEVVSFINESDAATSYYWNLGDGNTSTLKYPTNSYNIDGFYDVTMVVNNGCGSDTIVQTIIINPDNVLPFPDFSADILSGCGPLTVQFTDESSENTTGWWWQFQGGTPANSGEQNPIVVFENTGSYFVKLIASTNVGDRTKFKENFIEVTNSPPQALYTVGDSDLTIFLFNNSINADSYLWLFGDGNSSTEEGPTHSYATAGIYELSLIATNNCGSDTLNYTVDQITTNTFSTEDISRWEVYPNPNNGKFTVLLTATPSSEPTYLKVYDLLGQLVYHAKVDLSDGQLTEEINRPDLPKGTYQIIVENSEMAALKRVIVW